MQGKNIKKNKYDIDVVLLGESQVGKSTINDRLMGEAFKLIRLPTINDPYCQSFTHQDPSLPNSQIKINLWDTAGQERYRSNCEKIIKKADIILFIRDNQRENFISNNTEILGWFQFAEEIIDINEKKTILCLNKTDLIKDEEEYKNKQEELENRKQYFDSVPYLIYISSKNDNDIKNLKNLIIKCALEIIKDSNSKHQITISFVGPEFVGKTSLINLLMGEEFVESTIATTRLCKNSCYINIKDSVLKILYYDIPGQKKLMQNNLSILKKTDIIIFVNDNENLKIEYKEIKKKADIKGKTLIFCLNKLDLFKNGKSCIENEYREKNKDIINNKEIRLISAKTGEGIDNFKEYLENLANSLYETKSDNNSTKISSSIDRQYNGAFELNIEDIPLIEQQKKNCWNRFCNWLSSVFN